MSKERVERLMADLKSVRSELFKEAEAIKPEEFAWEPRPGMKSAKALLQEIGTMEKVCVHHLKTGKTVSWDQAVSWSGNDAQAIMGDLDKIRKETLAHLKGLSDADLDRPHQLPKEWEQYFGGPAVAPEEMIRWVTRHEYYHLGQLITYRWLLGYNPYQQK